MEYKVKLTNRNYLVPVSGQNRLALMNTGDGKQFLIACTCQEEFEKLGLKDARAELFSYERLKGIVIDDGEHLSGIVIDPLGKRIILNQESIEKIDKLSQGMSVRRTAHKGTVRVWQPKAYPAGMQETAEAYFSRLAAVRAAWMFYLQGEGEEKPHWVMLLDFTGDRKVIFPGVARMMKPFMKPGEKFELMEAAGELGEHARKKGVPLYAEKIGKVPPLN